MSKEAMKQALEAFEDIASWYDHDKSCGALAGSMYDARCLATLEAETLRTAISEAESRSIEQAEKQEPYPLEEMQEEILRLSEIISTNAFYQAGHANALEWAAEMAALEDPRTSDWVYDDPHELAKALRKGPDFPSSQQPAQQCRTDGRCQYAIDSGAEGMGHCQKGKCVMPAKGENK